MSDFDISPTKLDHRKNSSSIQCFNLPSEKGKNSQKECMHIGWGWHKKKGKKLCQETVNFFVFYDNDEYSRMCPGQKEFKSIKDGRGKNTPNQKRLLLMNLTIYSVQKQRTRLQSVFVFFPQLCELRSPWCIIVGAKRTHTVCMWFIKIWNSW